MIDQVEILIEKCESKISNCKYNLIGHEKSVASAPLKQQIKLLQGFVKDLRQIAKHSE